MKIDIKITSIAENILLQIDDEKNIVLYNNERKNIDAKKLSSQICLLVVSWKHTYINNSIIDGESFEITIHETDKDVVYSGRNSFPYDYEELKNLLLEVKNA